LGGTSLSGFGMMVDFNTSYYVVDYDSGVFLLNDNYGYVTKQAVS
jgi:predicted phage gp36 major capsid-like protein